MRYLRDWGNMERRKLFGPQFRDCHPPPAQPPHGASYYPRLCDVIDRHLIFR